MFVEAIQIADQANRKAFLDQACGQDTALRGRVDGLLNVLNRAGSFLESPAAAPGGMVESSTPQEPFASVVGPYNLWEQIGEGGMGAHFRPEPAEPVRRKVALKIIKPGMDSKQVV